MLTNAIGRPTSMKCGCVQNPAGPVTRQPAGSFDSLHRALCVLMCILIGLPLVGSVSSQRSGLYPASGRVCIQPAVGSVSSQRSGLYPASGRVCIQPAVGSVSCQRSGLYPASGRVCIQPAVGSLIVALVDRHATWTHQQSGVPVAPIARFGQQPRYALWTRVKRQWQCCWCC